MNSDGEKLSSAEGTNHTPLRQAVEFNCFDFPRQLSDGLKLSRKRSSELLQQTIASAVSSGTSVCVLEGGMGSVTGDNP